MREAAAHGFSTATDLADYLVRALDMPFRQAHHVTGRLVALAEDAGCDLVDLTLDQMQSVEPRLTNDIFTVLSVEASTRSRQSYGGTSPVRVAEQVAQWKRRLAMEEK
jgi:argininosuccinate lyase